MSAPELLAQLRDELAALAAQAEVFGPPRPPIRQQREIPGKVGVEWDAPGGRLVRVITAPGGDGEGVVFVEGSSYQFAGDMEALTVDQARGLAAALWAAAEWRAALDRGEQPGPGRAVRAVQS